MFTLQHQKHGTPGTSAEHAHKLVLIALQPSSHAYRLVSARFSRQLACILTPDLVK